MKSVKRLADQPMCRLMRRHPGLRYRLWRLTCWYSYNRGRWVRRLGRVPVLSGFMHWLWCYSAPLGACHECRQPTWNPVTFYVKHDIGRSGHYYCERCGPPILEAAVAFGERVMTDE